MSSKYPPAWAHVFPPLQLWDSGTTSGCPYHASGWFNLPWNQVRVWMKIGSLCLGFREEQHQWLRNGSIEYSSSNNLLSGKDLKWEKLSNPTPIPCPGAPVLCNNCRKQLTEVASPPLPISSCSMCLSPSRTFYFFGGGGGDKE